MNITETAMHPHPTQFSVKYEANFDGVGRTHIANFDTEAECDAYIEKVKTWGTERNIKFNVTETFPPISSSAD